MKQPVVKFDPEGSGSIYLRCVPWSVDYPRKEMSSTVSIYRAGQELDPKTIGRQGFCALIRGARQENLIRALRSPPHYDDGAPSVERMERAISDPRFPEFLKNPSGGKVKAVRLDPVFRSPLRRHPAQGLLSEGGGQQTFGRRPSLSCQLCDRRPIRRRVSARAVPQAWHRV